MSKLLEIFGKGITIDIIELIWNWLLAQNPDRPSESGLDAQLNKVIDLLSDRNIEQAHLELQYYLFEKPDCPKGRLAASSICIHHNDLDSAIQQAQSVYFRQPNNTMALYILGYCYERQGHVNQAVEFYQDCLKFKRHLQLPRQRLAAIYMRKGRLDKVIEEYIALTSEHPEDICSWVLLGYLYVAAEQYNQAIDTFNLAILSHPDNFNQENRDDDIDTLVQQGLYSQAIDSVQSMIEQLGAMPDLYIRLGDICRKGGMVTEAISYYETALRIQPNSLEATIKLGSQFLRDNHPALAAEQFNLAAEINDEIIDAYTGLAVAQELNGLAEDSRQTLSLACTIHQNSILLFAETAALHLQSTFRDSNESEVLAERDDLIETFIKSWKKRLDNTGPNADMFYKYGILLLVRGQGTEAIHWFSKAIAVNPTHYRSRIKLSMTYTDMGETDQGVDTLKECCVIPPSFLELHYQTALLFTNRQIFAKALRQLQASTFSGLSYEDTKDYIEVVLENLGIIDRALSNWSRIEQTSQFVLKNSIKADF